MGKDNVSELESGVRKSVARRRFLSLMAASTAFGIANCSGAQAQQTNKPQEANTVTPPPSATHRATTDGSQGEEEPSHEVRRDVMVEMRDGVELATDVHLPKRDGPFPTLVQRTPYNKTEDEPVGGISMTVKRGYAVIQQDVRGRFNSEGWFEPFFEGKDGYDTIEWAANQEWSNGDIGIYGSSYRGITTWQAILQDPPSLIAGAPLVTPTDYYANLQYMGGADNFGTALAWTASNSFSQISRLNVSKEKASELQSELEQLFANWPDSAAYLPTIDIPAFDQGVAQYWRDWHEHPTYDNYWKELDVLREIQNISVPVIHAGGWYDIFLQGHTSLYSAIEDRGTAVVRENQHMVIGPWSHSTYPTAEPVGEREFGQNAAIDFGKELVFPWFDYWLKGKGTGLDPMSKVQYYQMGDNEWRTAQQWPPDGVEATTYYLDSDGSANSFSGDGVLTTSQPGEGTPTDDYEYDPINPVPTRGGPLLMGPLQDAGVINQRPVEERNDVLVYTSEELGEPVSIAGPVDATLFVESTAPDTDFVVRLVDVEPDGYAANITEGALRARYRNSFEEPEMMDPGAVYELSVELRQVAHTFDAGHRIRLDITSSNFPKLDRNPNAAIPVGRATRDNMETATQILYHDADRSSRISLPIHN